MTFKPYRRPLGSKIYAWTNKKIENFCENFEKYFSTLTGVLAAHRLALNWWLAITGLLCQSLHNFQFS